MFLIGETRSIKFYIAPNGEKWLLRLLLRTVPTTTECRGQREGKCQRRGVRTTSQGTISAWAGCLYGKLTQSRFSARDSCNLKTSSSGKVTWLTYPYSFFAIEEAGFRWLWFFGYNSRMVKFSPRDMFLARRVPNQRVTTRGALAQPLPAPLYAVQLAPRLYIVICIPDVHCHWV